MTDMGDFEQTGMIAEGVCSEILVDVALILCDQLVKKMLCNTLLMTLHLCAQTMEVPTDSHMCHIVHSNWKPIKCAPYVAKERLCVTEGNDSKRFLSSYFKKHDRKRIILCDACNLFVSS